MRAVCPAILVCVSAAALEPATIEVVVGPAPAAAVVKLTEPFAVAFDSGGVMYVCEHKGQVITAVDPKGAVSRFAGQGQPGFGGDGGPAGEALFNDPHGLLIEGKRMYVADTLNHRVRLIDLPTRTITTVAGSGERGYSGDRGQAVRAAFNGTFGIAVEEKRRRLYIADLGNRRIRMVDLRSGVVSTVAGNGATGIPEDGAVATAAPLRDPRAVAVDARGNLYILERAGNALRVVDGSGRIRTLIAPGTVTPDLNGPKHLAVDRSGKVIIADAENHLIRTYDPARRTLTTIAGTGEKGSRVVAGDPLKTQLNRPHGVCVHKSGDIYIADSDNHRVLRLRR